MTGIAILALASNADRYIHRFIGLAKDIGECFGPHHIFVYESDSTDGTRSLLRGYESHDWIDVVYGDSLQKRFPHKTWRLAHARQTLMDKLVSSNFNPALVLVFDVEEAALDPKRVHEFLTEAMRHSESWHGVFPMPTSRFKALRYGRYRRNHTELENLIKAGEASSWMEGYLASIKEVFLERSKDGELMPVFSCFSGIGLYRYETYKKGKYSGANVFFTTIVNRPARSSLAPEESEHVNLHRSLGPNARLMVLPNISYPKVLS